MNHQTQLISEQELIGQGLLYWKTELLGACEYHLKMRRSRISMFSAVDETAAPATTVILTVVGTLAVADDPHGRVYRRRNQLTLHLSEDYLMPLCAIPALANGYDYKIYARVVTQPAENVDRF